LLIADEPTTALDVTIQAQILDLFRSMRQTTQLSMLFITHDLGVVAEVADRVYVMYAGQVVESGAIETILKSPRHPYTRGLIASVPRIDRPSEFGEKFYTIPGRAPQAWNLPKGCRFQARCAHAVVGVCDEGAPPLESLTAQHAVRCFRQQELNGAASV
jgi:oligopeptide/dipeptide ABC transporter ATP-binding protein